MIVFSLIETSEIRGVVAYPSDLFLLCTIPVNPTPFTQTPDHIDAP